MQTETEFDKYDIVEGFIPLKDTVVYAIELKKLNIKAAYEITLLMVFHMFMMKKTLIKVLLQNQHYRVLQLI